MSHVCGLRERWSALQGEPHVSIAHNFLKHLLSVIVWG